MVLNIGVAGAYIGSGVNLLDICLAQQETLGDFGICLQNDIMDFHSELGATKSFDFDDKLVLQTKNILTKHNIDFKNINIVLS